MDEEQRRGLENMLGSKGWTDVVEPELRGALSNYLNLLADPSITRPKGESDDHVRGVIASLRWILTTWEGRLKEAYEEEARTSEPEEPPALGSPYSAREADNPPGA